MIIKGAEIHDFRNISRASLAFSPSANLFLGSNGQGKTNLIEALFLFSLGRSFRTRNLDELVRFGAARFKIGLSVRSDLGVSMEMEADYEKGGTARTCVSNDRSKGFSALAGAIPAVIFAAEDVQIASGPPGKRRAFVDYTAAQISRSNLAKIRSFSGVLKRRNALLERAMKERGEAAAIEAWDEAFVEKAEQMVTLRRETLAEIEKRAGKILEDFEVSRSNFRLEYICSFDPDGTKPAERLREALERVRSAERSRGNTLVGPQLDDIRISIDALEVRRFASQGRKRLVALALKLAQAETIAEKRGESPVLFLDDIFSELDDETVEKTKDLIGTKSQSFLTSPRGRDSFAPKEDWTLFSVSNGVIEQVCDWESQGKRSK